jgi:FKBP-type peptidyl-prolyl cis-trans isomerase FkpA
MKKTLLLLALGALLFSCQGQEKKTEAAAAGQTSKADAGYAFGVVIGTNLRTSGVEVDYDAFLNGMKDVMEKNAPKVQVAAANQTIQTALSEAHVKKAQTNQVKETQFLSDNGKKTGVMTTASGLEYQVLKPGTGPKPLVTDTVKVDYVGTLIDGTTFDSSIERKQPAVFPLNGVIPGWAEGIQLMTVGSKYRLFIPSKLAYGENGTSGRIGPNETLIFDVDLLSIEPVQKPLAPGLKK